jgi:transcriptional regulator with XRE-family HTH domain
MAKTLGQRIAELRRDKNMTQKDLADAVSRINPDFGGAQSTIQAIEGGQSKKPTILYEIAKVLGTTVEYLRSGKDDNIQSAFTVKNKYVKDERNTEAKSKSDIDLVSKLLAAVHGSYLMLGLTEEQAGALSELVLEVAEEPPIPGVGEDGLQSRRLLAASATRRFLKPKHS